MGISSTGGLILGRAVQSYPAIATYQPVINGVAGEYLLLILKSVNPFDFNPQTGNLVSVQASRITTSLHQRYNLGDLPASTESDTHRETSRILLGAYSFAKITSEIYQ